MPDVVLEHPFEALFALFGLFFTAWLLRNGKGK